MDVFVLAAGVGVLLATTVRQPEMNYDPLASSRLSLQDLPKLLTKLPLQRIGDHVVVPVLEVEELDTAVVEAQV